MLSRIDLDVDIQVPWKQRSLIIKTTTTTKLTGSFKAFRRKNDLQLSQDIASKL